MKIIRYAHAGEVFWGLLQGSGVTPFSAAAEATGFDVLLQRARDKARAAPGAGSASPAVPLDRVTLLAPLVPSATVYCVGINYRAHASEAGRELPPYPSLFLRRQASLVGSGQVLEYPAGSTQYDFEGELALVIGTGGRDIAEADALGHIAAYTCLNDGSARDFQRHSVTAGKNFERSGACGPWLVTPDALGIAPDAPPALTLVTRLNGREMQRVGTGEMIYAIPALVSYVSKFARLQPGDIISTGTPEGVGAARTPPVWMTRGDTISVEISGIGTLENKVG
jgi:2-keto-4-pentenoate hydratase/2-oxohepta-3-ene-1,7-dioic acid hydratase in catechol pathway